MLTVTGSPPWRTVIGGSAPLRRAGRQGAHRRPHRPRRSARCAATRTASRSATTPTASAPVRRRGRRHPRRPGAAPARRPHRGRARRCSARSRYTRNATVLHTDASVLPRAPARAGLLELPAAAPATPADGAVQVSYDMNRLQRLDAPRRYVVTLNGADRVDPAPVIARMDYAHPVYTPASVAAQRRLPGSNDGVTAFAGAYHGWGFHEDGCRSGVGRGTRPGGDVVTRRPVRVRRSRHVADRPAPRTRSATAPTCGWSTSTTCPGCPGAAPLAGSTRATTSATRAASLRANVDAFLAAHGIDLRGGRVTDARPRPRARLRVQPADRLLVPRPRRHPGLRRRRGAQHLRRAAPLPAAPRRAGRADVAKEFYVSPFFPVDGALPDAPARAGRAPRAAISLHRAGRPAVRRHAARPAPAGHRRGRCCAAVVRHPWSTAAVSARIRWQACASTCAGCPSSRDGPLIDPRRASSDQHAGPGTSRPHPSDAPTRSGGPTSPAAAVARPRGHRRAPVRRGRGPAAAAGRAARRDGSRRRAAGRPGHAPAPARGVLPPARRRRPDRLRRVLHGRRLGRRRPAGLLAVFAAHVATLVPPLAAAAAHAAVPPPAARTTATPSTAPGATSTATTTCPTTCSRCSSTRR